MTIDARHPGVTILPFAGRWPKIAPDAFIAPGCRIIGDVTIGAQSSIWYNCVLRGDVNSIVIGARSNVQDGTVIHCDSGGDADEGHPTVIGDEVLIGHMALLHGCRLVDRCFMGMGAIAMDGSVVGEGAMLAAGAMLTPGKRIDAGELWIGRPARLARPVSAKEIERNRWGIDNYVRLAAEHRAIAAG